MLASTRRQCSGVILDNPEMIVIVLFSIVELLSVIPIASETNFVVTDDYFCFFRNIILLCYVTKRFAKFPMFFL